MSFQVVPDGEGWTPTVGMVDRHFHRCPHCHGYADLETHRCSTCGALAMAILWGDPTTPHSPELAMVERRR